MTPGAPRPRKVGAAGAAGAEALEALDAPPLVDVLENVPEGARHSQLRAHGQYLVFISITSFAQIEKS